MITLGDRMFVFRERTGYYYWDTPDGKDCFKKIWFATKYSTFAGLFISFHDIVLFSHPKGYFQGLSRVFYCTGPALAVGVSFSAMVCALTDIRKKDDEWNYLFSGFCAGSLWGACRRNAVMGTRFGVLGAILAFVTKISHDEQWNTFSFEENARDFGSINHYKFDWSLSKDPKDLK